MSNSNTMRLFSNRLDNGQYIYVLDNFVLIIRGRLRLHFSMIICTVI